MKKTEFLKYFREIESTIPKNDLPALREAWNNTIDSLCKDGSLQDSARNWSHPKRFYSKSEQRDKNKILVYSNLDKLFKDANGHQVTAQEILNMRTKVKDKWQEIFITSELKEIVCNRLVEIFGGTRETKERILRNLLIENRQNWGLQRVVIESYSGVAKLHYIAGQDMPSECSQIRKQLK